jgi:hypothetical protein
MSSIIIQNFYRNILSYQLTTHNKVPFFQLQKFTKRNSNSILFQSFFLRSYTNSIFQLSSSNITSKKFTNLNKIKNNYVSF